MISKVDIELLLDDFLINMKNGIEVKSQKNIGKTITKSLTNGKIYFAIYLKGLTEGGINNKI